MRCKILAALFFLLTLNSSLAQNLQIYQPPQPGATGYSDLFSPQNGVSSPNLLGKPHVNGITVFYPWSAVDAGSSPCVESGGTNGCLWTIVDGVLQDYINGNNGQIGVNGNGLAHYGQKINLIIEMVPEASTTDTTQVPNYVYKFPYGSWCATCAAQDMVSCPNAWKADSAAPTCSGGTPSQIHQCGDPGYGTPQAGVWNVNQCHLTGNSSNSGLSCGNSGPYNDYSGFPVVYEAPIMKAYETYVDTVLKHYSSQGTAPGPTIGQYIGYIRIGLADGGENLPICTSANINNAPTTTGIWPSPQGLAYDLTNYGSLGPDWFVTTNPCPGGANDELACRGKYAYLGGSPNGVQTDGPGYVLTIFRAFQSSRTNYSGNGFTPSVMANIHAGPPTNNPDTSWSDQDAAIFTIPCDSCTGAGFGEESLNEYDLLDSKQDPCTDDWCNLFDEYHVYGGNLYLQTTTPNPFVTAQIASVSKQNQTVTCMNNCTIAASFPGSSFKGLQPQEGFALVDSTGKEEMFKIASTTITSMTQFTFDPTTPYLGDLTPPIILRVGDYLPDTIPFAAFHSANTLEVYFCDWEVAYNLANSGTLGCQSANLVTATQATAYANILSNP
jgi:hypothetical protein